ncbi:MAG: CDP-glycerol glycerophosphotransferase family protein [Terrimesophilobacter sp.]
MPSFTFARGNASKLLSLPLYALGRLASVLVRRSDSLWVFACGSGIGEGSLELYRFTKDANPSLRLVWLTRDRAELARARDLGLTAATRSSWQGFRLTLRAGVLVLTHGLGDVNRFGTHGAFIVQLWHGIPLKKIQLDSPVTFRGFAPALMLRLYRRSTSAISLMPAASEVAAERLRSAFGLAENRVVVTGDPRDDVLFQDALKARELLATSVGDLGRDHIVLYAPTWRDGDPDPCIPTAPQWKAIAAHLERTSQLLVVRPHPHSVGDYLCGADVSPRIRLLSASAQDDINPVLPAIDTLITDYSSIAFDFALLGRPIVFLAPDAESYARTRGLYEPYKKFSGGSDVASWEGVLALLVDPHALSRLAAHAVKLAQTHHHFRDGRNTERLYEQLLTRVKGQA